MSNSSSFGTLRIATLFDSRAAQLGFAMNKRKFEEPKTSSVESHLVSCSPFQPQYEPEDAWMTGDKWEK